MILREDKGKVLRTEEYQLMILKEKELGNHHSPTLSKIIVSGKHSQQMLKKKLRSKFIGKRDIHVVSKNYPPQSYLQRCYSKEWSQLVVFDQT